MPRCLFNSLTGWYCPGCGVQRATHALLHGNFMQALDFNLMFVLFLPVLMYYLIRFLLGQKQEWAAFMHQPRFSRLLVAVVLTFWIMRNLPFMPFQWLAP